MEKLSPSERQQFEQMKEIIPEASIDDVHTAPNGMKFMSTPIKQDSEYISLQVRMAFCHDTPHDAELVLAGC